MDASLEQSCLEEISHTILDAQQKISVRSISNNYGLTFLDAVNILQQWIDKNDAKANLVKEFIVRGFDPKRGGAFITVVNEKKLKAVQSKVSQLSSVLYAVEVAAESSRKLVIPEEQEYKVINLPLQSGKRDVQVFTPAANPPSAAPVKQESKSKINSMFAASASKPKQEAPKPATVKEEKQSPPAATGKKDTAKAASPQKSPSKSSSPSKKKDAKKAVTGKASIASFFSNKPSSAKPTPAVSQSSGSPAAAEVKKEKESPKEAAAKESKKEIITNGTKKHEDTPRWKRMISDESDGDDVIPNTPQAKKEPAKKGGRKTQALKKAAAGKANPSKRSRILQVEDSSEEEEEDEEARKLREPEERLIKFDAEESEDAVMRSGDEEEKKDRKKPSPEKPVENDSNSLNRKRAKVKKMVTKNFMDDEGYMTTIKEYVMVSASEDEDEGGDASNNNAADGEKKAPAAEKKEPAASGGGGDKNSKSDDKPASKKPSKVTPPTPKTKQGSIMSFFSKK